jgi:hypothetical protein
MLGFGRIDGSTVRWIGGSAVRRIDGSTVRRIDGSALPSRDELRCSTQFAAYNQVLKSQ